VLFRHPSMRRAIIRIRPDAKKKLIYEKLTFGQVKVTIELPLDRFDQLRDKRDESSPDGRPKCFSIWRTTSIPILPRTSLGKSLGQKSQFLRSDK
jgi:hypothetical protein